MGAGERPKWKILSHSGKVFDHKDWTQNKCKGEAKIMGRKLGYDLE